MAQMLCAANKAILKKRSVSEVFDPNTSVCVGVCALTRRPLLQQSISGVTIDSVLFGWLRFFTILFILLY